MQIPIKLAKPGEPPEWYLIELQGTIESNDPHNYHGGLKSVGNLFFTKQGEPILIIGHHELRGKEIKLDKPILILRKRRGNSIEDGTGETDLMAKSNQINYEIAAVARQKLLFKNRPKPIVTTAKTVK